MAVFVLIDATLCVRGTPAVGHAHRPRAGVSHTRQLVRAPEES
jgi:hypothetical protein